jgi:CspA family cold shock protein
MQHGHVRWFNDAKGYGLIDCEEFDQEIYVDFRSLQDGAETLRPGDEVQFDVCEGDDGNDGPRAIDVHSKSGMKRRLFRR